MTTVIGHAEEHDDDGPTEMSQAGLLVGVLFGVGGTALSWWYYRLMRDRDRQIWMPLLAGTYAIGAVTAASALVLVASFLTR